MRLLTALAVVAAAASAFFLLTDSSSANTLNVGPGGYTTIGAAVQAASPGDTVRIHAGTYREEVDLGKGLTLRPYGDGAVTVDGECQRDHGVYIGAGSGIVIQGFTVKNTIDSSVLIERASDVTVDGMTIQDFACQGHDDVWRAGIASWYGGSDMTITNNTIQFRSSGSTYSRNDGIWFKSNDNNPSGGGHYIAGNTIIGGWDGIGGEEEGSAHGTFDRDTIVESNTIRDCWDDGIQSEGGDQNVRIRNNDISGCGAGIAFAAPVTGPLYIEDNYIHDLEMGDYGNLYCYKVGNSTSATVYLTGNTCDVDSAAEEAQGGADGIHQTNGGMFSIVSRDNVFHVSRYVFEIGEPQGSYDRDCMWTTDSGRFIKWEDGTRYDDLASFQAATGEEQNGRQGLDCSGPAPTRTPTRTPTPTPTRTPTPTPTGTASPTPTSTGTANPTATPASGYTPGPLPVTPGTPVPDESQLISAAMAPGWNYQCYVGESRPTEEVLATAAGRVSAAYRPSAGGVFDRWFPNLPEVSTLTTVNPGDTLFVLTSDPFLWTQAASDTESTVDLAQGWNGVCCLGGSGPVEAATLGMDIPYAVIYSLAGETWQRFVPGRPEISNLSQLAKFTPVLILVTDNSHWIFNP